MTIPFVLPCMIVIRIIILQRHENKAIFFARKFEPIVNQDIINSMDINMFGKEMTGENVTLNSYPWSDLFSSPGIKIDIEAFPMTFNI